MTDDIESLKATIAEFEQRQHWWHDIEVAPGVFTIGRKQQALRENHDAIKWQRIARHLDFKDKRVLDVGCNEGFYLVQAKLAGARNGLGIDIDPLRVEKANWIFNTMGHHDLTASVGNALDIAGQFSMRFDVVLALGLIHRVPDPFTAISSLASLAEVLVIEWPAYASSSSLARFWGGDYKRDSEAHNTGFWQLSRSCVQGILERSPLLHSVYAEPYARRSLCFACQELQTAKDIYSKRRNYTFSERLRYFGKQIEEWARCGRDLLFTRKNL